MRTFDINNENRDFELKSNKKYKAIINWVISDPKTNKSYVFGDKVMNQAHEV